MAIAQIVDDRYRLDAVAGAGGMGTVWRATDLATGAVCAVKLIATELRGTTTGARIQTEIAALAALRHDGVVRTLGHGNGPSGPYLVMEWVEGETLRERLSGRGLRLHEALLVTAQLTRALAAVHRAGVVHRDVKPRNIMLEDGDVRRAKLVDFGVARVAAMPGLTATGTRLGTPRYMAPEQILHSRRVDGRADVFSLGCVLFEMVTGRRAFVGDDEVALLARMLIEDAPLASSVRHDLPPAVDRLVERLLARDPRGRPHAEDALANEIDALAIAFEAVTFEPVRAMGTERPNATTVDDVDEPLPTSVLSAILPNARLPARRGEFVGRVHELESLRHALQSHDSVAVWGAVGCGKSRLLVEMAHAETADARRDVTFVDLYGASEPDIVTARVAAALGVERADDTRVGRALGARDHVLVLDGADAALDLLASRIAAWRKGAPSLRIVVGARARFAAESAIEVGPLADDDALALLERRIAERGDSGTRSRDSLKHRVLPRLEGNPLLIELAAARFSVLGAERLAARLVQPLEVFDGARASEYRFTLSEAIEISWRVLTDDARRALAVCAAFVAPFELESAETVARAVGLPRALELLQSLRDHALLVRSADDPSRWLLSEPVRAFAVKRAHDEGFVRRVFTAHAGFVTVFAEAASDDLAKTGRLEARRGLEALERDVEAIFERHAQQSESNFVALRAWLAIEPVLALRAPVVVHLQRIDRVLATIGRAAPIGLVARARQARGRALGLRGRTDEARHEIEAALATVRELGDVEREAAALLDLGVVAHGAGDLVRAEECYGAVLSLRGRFESAVVEARALGNLGAIAHDRHDLAWAYRRYVEAIAIVEASGDERLLGVFLGNLAVLDRERGDLPLSRQRFFRALAALEKVGDVRLTAITLGNLGMLELERDRLDAALEALSRARDALARFGDVRSESLAISRQAAVLALSGKVEQLEDAQKGLFLAERNAKDDVALGVVLVARACVDLGLGDAEAARAKIARVRRAEDGGPALIDRSDDVRAIVRVVSRRLGA